MRKLILIPLALITCLLTLIIGSQLGWVNNSSPDLLNESFIKDMYKLSLQEPNFYKESGFGGNGEQLLYLREKDKVMFSIHYSDKGFTFYFKHDPPEYPEIAPMELDVKSANKLFDKLVFPNEKLRAKNKRELEKKLKKIRKTKAL